ncbi:MAG TPA: hypothetical protein VGD74_09600 [Vulgatibacter sp.]
MRWGIVCGVAAWALALGAAAEPKIVQEPDREVVRKKTTVDFNDVRLDGELTKPEGGYVPGREETHFDNLLKPRKDFLQELEKSAEGL